MRVNGQVVRNARKAMDMSRAELAVAIGISIATIENVEREDHDVAAGTAFLIAQALGLQMEEMFTESAA